MRWTVHGERSLYESDWVSLWLADVELPDGERFEHHLIRVPGAAAGVVVVDPEKGVLLLWRHRFITDTWGWEVPAGRVEAGESPVEAAAREVLEGPGWRAGEAAAGGVPEETGWPPGPLEPLGPYPPSNGLSDQTFHLFLAGEATEV